jgi:hypothetical protein
MDHGGEEDNSCRKLGNLVSIDELYPFTKSARREDVHANPQGN